MHRGAPARKAVLLSCIVQLKMQDLCTRNDYTGRLSGLPCGLYSLQQQRGHQSHRQHLASRILHCGRELDAQVRSVADLGGSKCADRDHRHAQLLGQQRRQQLRLRCRRADDAPDRHDVHRV
eukprot:6181297-Pleurochrysis_carterae.AAC.1